MQLGEFVRLAINLTTIVTMVIVVVVVALIIRRKGDLSKEIGVSGKTYLLIVGAVEIVYTTGIILILYAMGVNVLQHLQNLEFGKFLSAIDSVDVSKMKFAGTLGWIGFGMNCAVTFLAPGYLLIRGGKKLPRFIWVSAWTEIGLETIVISLVFTSLFIG
jgi:hypothetical protein